MDLVSYLRHIVDIGGHNYQIECGDLTPFTDNPASDVVYLCRVATRIQVIHGEHAFSEWTHDHWHSVESVTLVIKGPERVTSFDSLQLLQLPIHNDPDLASMIRMGLAPVFDAMAPPSQLTEATKKKFGELSTSLLHLNSGIEVPDLASTKHVKLDEGSADDAEFLNELTSVVNRWISQILAVTQLDHDPHHGASMGDEVVFWRAMDHALVSLSQQIGEAYVTKSLDILNQAKRFHITTSFANDLGVAPQVEKTKHINAVLRELPLADLEQADTIDKLEYAIDQLFTYFRAKLSVSVVALERLVAWTELVTGDVTKAVTKVIMAIKVNELPYDKWLEVYDEILTKIITPGDHHIKYLTNVIRELVRKRSEKLVMVSIDTTGWTTVKDQLAEVAQLRATHHELMQALVALDAPLDRSTKLMDAFNQYMVPVDAVASAPVWKINQRMYTQQATQARSFVATELNRVLSDCDQFSDYLGALKGLHSMISDEFRLHILESALVEVKQVAATDIFGGGIIASAKDVLSRRQLLSYYTSELEKMLGANWCDYSVGATIAEVVATTNSHLSAKEDEIAAWVDDAGVKMAMPSVGNVAKFVETPAADLVVNYNSTILDIAADIRHLAGLGFVVPAAIMAQAQRVISKMYGLVTGLSQHLQLFKSTITDAPYSAVMEPTKYEIIDLLRQVLAMPWTDVDVSVISALQTKIGYFGRQINEFSRINSRLSGHLIELKQAPFDLAKINGIVAAMENMDIGRIQESVMRQINDVLGGKGLFQLKAMESALSNHLEDITFIEDQQHQFWGTVLPLPPMDHHIIFAEQQFVMSPPLSESKQALYHHLNQIITVTPIDDEVKRQIGIVLEVIDGAIAEVEKYFANWRVIQTLWELDLGNDDDMSQLFNGTVGQSLSSWLGVMSQVAQARRLFDTGDTTVYFGQESISVNYGKVQSRVTLKFDRFFSDLRDLFAKKIAGDSEQFVAVLEAAKSQLSSKLNLGLDISSVITALHQFLSIKSQFPGWQDKLGQLNKAHSVLIKSRYKFPLGWVYCDQLDAQMVELTNLITRKSQVVDEDSSLTEKVKREQARVAESVANLHQEWALKKPVSAQVNPVVALATLATFSQLCANLTTSISQVSTVGRMLVIPMPSLSVDEISAEISDHNRVWTTIHELWEALAAIKQTKWGDVHPRSVRKSLDALLAQSRSLPATIKQYTAYDELITVISNYLKSGGLVSDLKSEAMKARHWKLLLPQAGPGGPSGVAVDQLTLGDIWGINLAVNEALVREVLVQANNEQLIEDNLVSINQAWQTITFELFPFENRARLVKNWDGIFDQCHRDLATLTSMKSSPYYHSFDQEISDLDAKLNKILVVVDRWIEVQHQWVYLSGVFAGGEIKSLLALETTRFTNVTYEYLNLTKKLFKMNLVWDILSVGDLVPVMSRLGESLVRIRKSLTEYLERQREVFPRFYFLGNEDLLTMIGQSSVAAVNVNVAKMFAGVRSLKLDPESLTITHFVGDFDEQVKFYRPVSLIKQPKLSEWLSQVDTAVRESVAHLVSQAVVSAEAAVEKFPTQVAVVATQVGFTREVDVALADGTVSNLAEVIKTRIATLVATISSEMTPLIRMRTEHLVIELLHQRDIVHGLISRDASDRQWWWQCQQRFYYDDSADALSSVTVCQGVAEFAYGFEYVGTPEKLAYTPLMDRCFLTLSQALHQKLGGSPYGPAGTGKTETVKALAHNLGKMVVVFNCDDSFDFQSMGRIFLGLCRVGVWGCFDEFNRLDARLLSSVSNQIEVIESGLGEEAEISGKTIEVDPTTGIFVTMNPGYAGRSQLPENLQKLFRSFAMTVPDHQVIVDVLLSSHGFIHAAELAKAIVPLFLDMKQKASHQSHYDFGLRSLKRTLVRCGEIKVDTKEVVHENEIVVQAIFETIAPKLTYKDESLLSQLIQQHFGCGVDAVDNSEFVKRLGEIAGVNNYDATCKWVEKASHLYNIQRSHHGIILVGDSGSGKSAVWQSTLAALPGDSVSYVIDPKVMTKQHLYGKLDPVTRDWTDGLLTQLLRKINANLRGELSKRTWIVFDGDIDPEWVENLNSVLDDNKVLTLPTGERIPLPPTVRIVFEVDNLAYTTPATVSRCGMVWFDLETVTVASRWKRFLHHLEKTPLDDVEGSRQRQFARVLSQVVTGDMFERAADMVNDAGHMMEFSVHRALQTFETLISSYCKRLSDFDGDSAMIDDVEVYVAKSALLSMVWAFAGDIAGDSRSGLVRELSTTLFPEITVENVLEMDIRLPEVEWVPWSNQVAEKIDLEPQQVNANTVVSTADTACHRQLIHDIISQHRPLVLCGPPGSGKTMTLLESLRQSPNLSVLSLNFSKDTSPESLMKSLEHYCEYRQSVVGVELTPKIAGMWVVVFCDEINLPKLDDYGTQRVIALMRQMIEHHGFWNNHNQWVTLGNIQFVGACNSPDDPGRNLLSPRFLRHVSVVVVDYPGPPSLNQIYLSFNAAVLKCCPRLRAQAEPLTKAMIEVYQNTKAYMHRLRHYVYSPRELTRWSRGMLEVLSNSDISAVADLVRVWYHEGLRLFYDRLVSDEERQWQQDQLSASVGRHFPSVDVQALTQNRLWFSHWLSMSYEPVCQRELSEFVGERLRVFSEEEVEVDLVLHPDFLDHCLRVDRVLRQNQGHMILVGDCASGKTTVTKFVAWINGLKSVQLSVDGDFGIDQFDGVLRQLLLRCAKGEQICFIIDESSIRETAFIERMNTLLANSEVPGLFEGDEFSSLMNLCLEQSQSQGLLLDNNAELYQWFSSQISHNLHVVFTLSEVEGNSVVSSPALFNRCVLNWMGSWRVESITDVAMTMVETSPLDMPYQVPDSLVAVIPQMVANFRMAVVDALVWVYLHQKSAVPLQFITFVQRFLGIFSQQTAKLEANHRHISLGLDKLRETVVRVHDLQRELETKQKTLSEKDAEAKQMLNTMLSQQNEAERKREFSVDTQAELAKQEKIIEQRRAMVMNDLKKVEPAVAEAQQGVQNIKKHHLTEIRSMGNPPNAVKITMESVCVLLGYEVKSWREVQLQVRRDDFIANIVNFNSEQVSASVLAFMEKTYLSREDYNYESVQRASKACGPLLQWVVAQLTYSKILNDVAPLRDEVASLEHQTKNTKAKVIAVEQMVEELEQSIEKYKEEYSEVIRAAEAIKHEMEVVKQKVTRSTQLIDDLTSERDRWKQTLAQFGNQRQQLIGDALLSASLLVFGTCNDQKRRGLLERAVKDKLAQSQISFDPGFTVAGLMGDSALMAAWEDAGLANDDLHVVNFIELVTTTRPVLVIDPNSQAVEVLKKVNAKVTVESILHEGFVGKLENALRFGGTLVVTDGEFYDPVLNSVFRGEIHRNGGRTMMMLGDKLVDYSPEFRLVLHTRDHYRQWPAFITSRASVVNFTITSGSLENTILDVVLHNVRPDIEVQRRECVQLRSKYQVRLHSLEVELLASVSEATSILDNDAVIDTLEQLKVESAQLDVKLAATSGVMANVEAVRQGYAAIANHARAIFEFCQRMVERSPLYVVNLDRFMMMFHRVMSKSEFEVEVLIDDLYREVFASIAPSVCHQDKIALAIGLVDARRQDDVFSRQLAEVMAGIAEGHQVEIDGGDLSKVAKAVANGRPDEYMDELMEVSSHLFTGSHPYSSKYEIGDFVNMAGIFVLVSPDGYDPTSRVEALAKAEGTALKVISMGSKEAVDTANRELEQSTGWLLLQNVQMTPQWLDHLDKKLPGTCSKVFVTCSVTSQLPSSLVAMSQVVMFENQSGWRHLVEETSKLVGAVDEPLVAHACFMLVLFHSILLERMRYVPIAFKRAYEINDADFYSAAHVIRALATQDTVKWRQIAYMVGVVTYASKIDDVEDAEYVTTLANHLFSEASLSAQFNVIENHLTKGVTSLQLPKDGKYQGWIEELPAVTSTTWVGLDEGVQELVRAEVGRKVAQFLR